jgi:hypothetical protein
VAAELLPVNVFLVEPVYIDQDALDNVDWAIYQDLLHSLFARHHDETKVPRPGPG